MKKNIIFGVFALVLMAINVAQSFQSNQEGFSLGQLFNVAVADPESGGTYTCETSVWAETYGTCPNGFDSYCQYTEISCWESPYGLFDENMNCSIIACSDCATGLQGIIYNDCPS